MNDETQMTDAIRNRLAAEELVFAQELHDRRVAEVDKAIPERFRGVGLHEDAAAWAQMHLSGMAGNLVIVGPTGVGKTAACWGVLRAIVDGGSRATWRFWNAADLAAALRSTDVAEETVRSCRATGLLVVDDLAVSGITDWQTVQLTRIFDDRWQHCRPTIVTSNIPNLREALDDRIASRLQDGATILTIRGSDRRRSG